MSTSLFVGNLILAIAALAATVLAGWSGRRRLHFVCVAGSILLLSSAIVQADIFGRAFIFSPLRLRLHLTLALAALACLPGVTWTGIGVVLGRTRRQVHGLWVVIFLAFVVLAVASAIWMFLDATVAPGY